MRLVTADSVEQYLRDAGRIELSEQVAATELAGGVSNIVLRITRGAQRPDLVVKQARDRLRVAEPWFCSVERIWREVEVLEVCQRTLDKNPAAGDTLLPAVTPRLLFTDPENYLFAMTAAPPHQVWKQQLLAGEVDLSVARACGDLLGRLHAGTWHDAALATQLDDRQFFFDLRVDPYYRHVARSHPDLHTPIEALIHSLDQYRVALVHGDFSPKNLLVSEAPAAGLMLVDFEVGHFGDPAFDLGFFLSHLVLKAIRAGAGSGPGLACLQASEAFWETYRACLSSAVADSEIERLVARAIRHFAACALARVDGKSTVDYLNDAAQATARTLARGILLAPPPHWSGVLAELRPELR